MSTAYVPHEATTESLANAQLDLPAFQFFMEGLTDEQKMSEGDMARILVRDASIYNCDIGDALGLHDD